MFDDAGRPVTTDLDGPCTPNQWGRVRREFERLGLADLDGAELGTRLLLTGQLAGRGAAVSSTRDLTAGEAGRVVRLLAGCRTLSDAESLADPARAARQRACISSHIWLTAVRVAISTYVARSQFRSALSVNPVIPCAARSATCLGRETPSRPGLLSDGLKIMVDLYAADCSVLGQRCCARSGILGVGDPAGYRPLLVRR